ncbi:RluA family pseudouridine synthase [Helicobacter trogontum]|uniref:RNA pseudouridylate synthase n=1 Tax=Helicobacter trogontum TaxID=50960 RepID=A0A4U8TE16_9HELI|nr:RluA family pseudouridine synthase [Helicobacter trogontum]MCI5786307.1 RluA family pseudouridine synthase [Helicobacter trogontum]MDY5186190.1 RluA family pseudouridine synthase [Helicobacter trogontum]TLD98269.1 RluA family pseudouridine synthase [Helicobacter trogontum]
MKLLYHFCILHGYSRLDSALQEILHISRSQASQWIESKLVKIDEQVAKKGKILKKGACIQIYTTYNASQQHDTNKEELIQKLEIEIIHENNDYIILNKPRNLVVHHAPSVKEITLTDYLQANNYELSTINGELRFGIVHRLDKDTSGAILVAKNNASHLRFAEMLQNRTMGRIYICVINKALQHDTSVECHMGRNPNNRLKMAKLDKAKYPYARDSKSEFRKIMESRNGVFELIGVRLFSGRTHQIRVHLSTLQRYIYGDILYSPENLKSSYKTKMLLHAQLLYFDGNVFSAKIPKDLLKFLEENFIDYESKLEAFLLQWKNELQQTRF